MKVKSRINYSKTQNITFGVPSGSVMGLLLFLIFMNILSIDVKSEIKLFAGDIKLLLRPISKEITQVGQNT